MKKGDLASYILSLILVFAGIACGFLVSKGILPQICWFAAIFLISLATFVYSRRNYINMKNEIEERRKKSAERKNQRSGRYL
ncbi:MAG TPA: hypothetical protein PLM59_08855 [Oscillospiraceae bacterium]|jgi:uncharacterized membrane protein YfcA|nr:hypothetical protein [Oscillospiraceae bacterium]MDN5378911.1 hypothetical protein [Clostridiales bacterium]HOV41888.1 hypothetical protein [Oscillospiraceae bacterium]